MAPRNLNKSNSATNLQGSPQPFQNDPSPSPVQQKNSQMAYINISSDGYRPVGPLGIKKAEQELIKRRYK